MRSLGVDVGQHHHDAVLLNDRTVAETPVRFSDPSELERLIGDWRPQVLAFDSPPGFAPSGSSRLAERTLHRRGIRIFPCPCAERADGNAFFDWMRVGFGLFAVAGRLGFDVGLDPSAVNGKAVEVYPHGSAVTLRGARPPAGTLKVARFKRAWRAQVLVDNGVEVGVLTTVHQVDAALAALTGARALEGAACAVGSPEEGVVILPVPTLLDRYEEEHSADCRAGSRRGRYPPEP